MSEAVSPLDVAAAALDAAPRRYQRWAASDQIRLIVGLIVLGMGLFLAAIAQNTIGGAERDIVSWFNRLPERTEGAVIGAGQILVVGVPLAIYGLLLWRRNFRLVGLLIVGPTVASAFTTLVESRYSDRLGVIEDASTITRGWIADPGFPSSSLIASTAAFVTITAPWLGRRWRRAAWASLLVVVFLRILGSGEPPLDVVLAIAIGLVFGSLTLMIFGSPTGVPRAAELVAALRSAGLAPTTFEPVGEEGTIRVRVGTDAGQMFVKVRTPEDRSNDLLNRAWASLRLRSSEVERPYSSLKRRVEHEAFAGSLAHARGVSAPEVFALGQTTSGAVYLAQELLEGTTLATLEAHEIGAETLDGIWEQVAALRQLRLAHQNLSPANIVVDTAGQVWILDFDRAEVGASPRDLSRDVAQLLITLAASSGVARTVGSAVAALGSDAVADALPQLQPLALSPEVARIAKSRKGLLDELSAAVEQATGAEPVQLEKLERIKPKTLLMILVAALAFYSLLPQLANIDDTVDAFGDANFWWIPAILAGSAITYVFATVSALGAYSLELPVLATFRSGLASSFTALVAPANAGGMALGVRFLQRAGFDTPAASTAVGLNAVGGIAAHVVLLFAFVSWTGQTGVGDIRLPDASTTLIVLGVVLALSVGLLLVGPIRRRVLTPVIRILRSAGQHLGSVFTSPLRVLALFGGSALVTLAYAATLVFSVEAFGGGITVPEICTAFIVATTIATVAPTPGGLGALEAAMIASLVGFGMDHGPAVSATLTFRLATFWLPILPGWATFTWMERHGEL